MRMFVRIFALLLITGLIQGQGCSPSDDNGSPNGTAPATLGGQVNVANFTLPAGQTSTVTSDLIITATGNVTIAGQLIADDATSGNGYSITIVADGDIDVSGTIQAGAPATTLTSSSLQPAQTAEESGSGAAGADGASINIRSDHGNITIRSTATLIGTDGTSGLDGFLGGVGGKGGSIALCTTKKLTVKGSLWLGDGGNGGNATLTSDDLKPFFLDQDPPYLFGNAGGDSGYLYVTSAVSNYDWPHFSASGTTWTIDVNAYNANPNTGMIIGGTGGNAGTILLFDPFTKLGEQITTLQNNPPLTSGQPQEDAIDRLTIRAARGGHGWLVGGFGGFITASPQRWQDKAALAIEVYGGDGGNVSSRADATIDCGNSVQAIGAVAGTGGLASCVSPVGIPVAWAGGDPNGGWGGIAIAHGGNGGQAEEGVNQTGGDGGTAVATAGSGADGRSSCFSVGNGGQGGRAHALGGNGGDALTPGKSGQATATGGNGGDGGNGENSAGLAGDGGEWTTKDGADGSTGMPGEVVYQGIEFNGEADAGQAGQTNYYTSPDYCASVDYDCPNGNLCGH